MRYGEGVKFSALYRQRGEDFEMSTLPSWQTENRAYFQAANAILHQQGILPASTYKVDGRRTLLKIG